MDYTVPSINREFGSVFLGDKNVAVLVVSAGWAKVYIFIYSLFSLLLLPLVYALPHTIFSIFLMQVREQGQQKGEASPFLAQLLRQA